MGRPWYAKDRVDAMDFLDKLVGDPILLGIASPRGFKMFPCVLDGIDPFARIYVSSLDGNVVVPFLSPSFGIERIRAFSGIVYEGDVLAQYRRLSPFSSDQLRWLREARFGQYGLD